MKAGRAVGWQWIRAAQARLLALHPALAHNNHMSQPINSNLQHPSRGQQPSRPPKLQAFVICVKSPVGQVAPSLAASGALSGVLEVAGVLDPIVKTPSIQ